MQIEGSTSASADVPAHDRAEPLPPLACEAMHLHLLDGIEVGGASIDLDAGQQHAEFETLQVRGLLHHVNAREIVAALLEHLNERLRNAVAVGREARSFVALR